MNFNLFLKNIPKIEKIPLFGSESHLKMAPMEQKKMLKFWDYSKLNPKKAGVLALFYPKKNNVFMVLIVRTSKGIHSSQIAFPGGKLEETDNDLSQTAIRETEEEIGIPKKKIHIIKELSLLYIPPSNFLVNPFVGFLDYEPKFIPQKAEVAQILEVPLCDFLNIAVTHHNIKTSYSNYINVPTFVIQKKVVWGATAMILSELKDILRLI